MEEKLDHESLPVIINKYDLIHKKHRHELEDNPKKEPNRRFLHSELTLIVIMDCTTDK